MMRSGLTCTVLAVTLAIVCVAGGNELRADPFPHEASSHVPATARAAGGSLGPRDTCTSIVGNYLRALQHMPPTPDNAAKLTALPAYEKKEAACRRNLRAWNQMSSEQKEQEIARRQAAVDADLRALAEQERYAPPPPAPELGIGDPLDPLVLGRQLLPPENTWFGKFDGTLIDVAGSARTDNPAQGVVFVMADGDFASRRAYNAPSATGPLIAVSAAGDIITLRSVPGRYVARASDGTGLRFVRPKGGVLYYFNLRTRTFE